MRNGGKNRNKVDITYSILATARSGALKTHLMREANLNSSQITKLLETLVNHGLIAVETSEGLHLYQTTSRGAEFIRNYNDLLSFITQPVGDAVALRLRQQFA